MILNFNVAAVPDLVTVKEGDYLLRLDKVDPTESKKTKRPGIQILFSLPEEDHTKSVMHWIYFPMEGDNQKTSEGLLSFLKEFYKAFGVDYMSGNVDTSDLIGLQGRAHLKEEEGDFGIQNRITRFAVAK